MGSVSPKTLLDADSVQQLHIQQPSTYAKPEAASAVLGSWWWAVCYPKHVELHIKYEIKILIHCRILLDFICELYYDAQIHKHQVYHLPTLTVKVKDLWNITVAFSLYKGHSKVFY
jgi:hypothetical protein